MLENIGIRLKRVWNVENKSQDGARGRQKSFVGSWGWIDTSETRNIINGMLAAGKAYTQDARLGVICAKRRDKNPARKCHMSLWGKWVAILKNQELVSLLRVKPESEAVRRFIKWRKEKC